MTTPLGSEIDLLAAEKVQGAPPVQEAKPTKVPVVYAQKGGLLPSTFDEAYRMASAFANSGMVPDAYQGKPEAVFVAMQMGAELGLPPMQAVQNIAVINGKPAIYGDMGKALLLAGGCIIEEDDTEVIEKNGCARCKITRPGRPPTERTFSLADAAAAGLTGKKGPWTTYKWRQMAWRAFWFAARDGAADLLKGMRGAEEVADYTTEREVEGTTEIIEQPKRKEPAAAQAGATRGADIVSPASAAATHSAAPGPARVLPGTGSSPASSPASAEPSPAPQTGEAAKPATGSVAPGDKPAEREPIEGTATREREPGDDDEEIPAQFDDSGPRMQVPMMNIIRKRLEGAGLTEAELQKKFGRPLADLPAAQFNAVQVWLKTAK